MQLIHFEELLVVFIAVSFLIGMITKLALTYYKKETDDTYLAAITILIGANAAFIAIFVKPFPGWWYAFALLVAFIFGFKAGKEDLEEEP